MLKRQVIIECIAALLIMLFLYASVSKFLDFKTFTREMNNQPLPKSWTPFLVWFIPLTEILICLILVFEKTRTLGFYLSAFFMTLFTVYTSIILLHFFTYIPCSCGGVIKKLSWRQHLVFNLFFVALSITGIALQHRKNFQTIIFTNKKSLV